MLEGPWWFGLAALTAAYWAVTAVRVSRGMATVGFLRDVTPTPAADAPRVSVCVAARNEEEKVARGVRSMAELEYPSLEVVAVDDRSEDGTGRVLDALAEEHDRLRVLHVEELPRGWLGKNHALQRAADAADGEVLLFTDADVVFRSDALARAVGRLERGGLDHLAVAPDIRMPGPLLEAFAGCFQVLFTRFAEPWRARDPESGKHVGIGAFNLVRRDAYRAAGEHRGIRHRPDDDMRLARALGESGARADILYGTGLLQVPWYDSLPEAVRGLSRSAWAGLDYSLPGVAGAAVVTVAVDAWPWLGWLLTGGPARWLNLVVVLLCAFLFVGATRYSSVRPWLVVLWPVTAVLFAWILLRSAALALLRGGIEWRGTFYPLEELRR